MREYIFQAKPTKIVDGDTFDAVVDMGFRMFTEQRFRLAGIDTPETYRPSCNAELTHGIKAAAFVSDLLIGQTVMIQTFKDPGVYNRYTAKVTLPDGRDLTTVMREAGFEKQSSYSN